MNKIARKQRRQKKMAQRYKPSSLTHAISKTFKRIPMERRLIGDNVRWYVMRTAVRAERLAKLRIRALGYEVFLPLFTEEVQRKHGLTKQVRVVDVERPLMPGYLFAAVPNGAHHDPRHIVRSVDEVTGVLGFDGQPITVPPRTLQRISDILTGHDEESQPIEIPPLQEGDQMRVIDGPFAQFQAVVEEVINSGRVKALVNIFGRLTPVEFDLAQLQPLN